MSMADTLEILGRMSKKNNQALKLSPLSNVKSARSGKDGWGDITIALPNDLIAKFLTDSERLIGGLLICDRSEFEKEKKLMESEDK